MIPAEVEGALFLFRRTGLTRIREVERPHGAETRTVRMLSLAISPWGVRMGLGRSMPEEVDAAHAFIASTRPGFRLDSADGLRPDPRTRQALEAVWSAIPASARCGVLVAEAAVYGDGKTAVLFEKAYLYNLPCADFPEAVARVSRPLPKTCPSDGPAGLWMAAHTGERRTPLLIPARTESEAAIRFVSRMMSPEGPAPAGLEGYRISPFPTRTALEIATIAGLFTPEPENDPSPLNFS